MDYSSNVVVAEWFDLLTPKQTDLFEFFGPLRFSEYKCEIYSETYLVVKGKRCKCAMQFNDVSEVCNTQWPKLSYWRWLVSSCKTYMNWMIVVMIILLCVLNR